MEEFKIAKEAAKKVLVDQNNNNSFKVTINMETNTKTLKFFEHGYSINSAVSGETYFFLP